MRQIRYLVAVVLILPTLVYAQSGPSEDGGDLRAKTQNPVGSLISVPFEINGDYGAESGDAFIMNIQPVIPFRVGDP